MQNAKLIGQKFFFAIILVAIASVGLFTGHLSENGWLIAGLTIFGAFGGLNIASKFFRPTGPLAGQLAALVEEDQTNNRDNPAGGSN